MMYLRILTLASTLVVQALCVISGILFGIQICYCDVTWSTYYKHENIRLTTGIYDQIERVTDLVCCTKCHSDSSCNSVNYNSGTRECQLSMINLTEVDTDRDSEWVTYSKNKPSCKNYLVSGPNGVNDSQLTESDHWCKERSCIPPDEYSAKYARMNVTGSSTDGWLTDSNNAGEYIQVDFQYARTISAIALQCFRYSNCNGYVTSFKVLTSMDCGSSFTAISNETGNDKIFDGNSDSEAFVIRDMPEGVRARCVRINPVTWVIQIGLRFDVLGC